MKTQAALALSLVLSACASAVPSAAPPSAVVAPAAATSAILAGVASGPRIGSLPISDADARGALSSFIVSCPQLLSRTDQSGLTRNSDWAPACEAARTWPQESARGFFETQFQPVEVGDGRAFATGYFEPEIRGSRTRSAEFDVPVYALPDDLTRGWPADIPEEERTGRMPLGRYDANGDFVRYHDRAAIVDGALDGRVPAIAWAADPIEFFFLQIQGSGRLRAPDGKVIRIGYAGQNGRGYTAIGAVMRERGLIGEGTPYPTSLQGITAWLRDNPSEANAIMNINRSWVFFRELTGEGPLGALGVPVRANDSVAADPAFVPLGSPVWLDLDRNEADGLWIAQDTGGAIKGANRFDTFWGAGEQAREIAGSMTGRGRALILLPKASAARLVTR